MVQPTISTLELNHKQNASAAVETDHLIVGAGPAGGSLACFLAQHGLKGTIIAAAPGTADTPRAHITNMAALECLRDIGLEEDCVKASTKGDCMLHTRWCRSMAGDEYARIYSWGNDPARHGDYDGASPCNHVDLPQTILEPILLRYATLNGFTLRFDTTFLSFETEPSGTILSRIRDNLTKQEYTIRSKYLYGCDGARSQVIRQLAIPLIKKPGQGLAINILVEADLSHLVETRKGNLHWIMQPDLEHPVWGWSCIARMVKPWNEWMFILFPEPGAEQWEEPTQEEYLQRVKEFIGDDNIPAKILNVSKWKINDIVAERYSEGNIFCLGDAVHRHPPLNGLGSNTCIQDAYNLAWKIAYTEKSLSSASLLSSFSPERQPVGHTVITRANQGFRDHKPVWDALALLDKDVSTRAKKLRELGEATKEGRERREKLRKAVQETRHEYHGVGVEMNQRYVSSAIYLEDEGSRPALPEDPVLEHEITTYPGSRLPHAWLNTKTPGTQISTIDLAGHGKFCLLTGIGGGKWKDAAKQVGGELGFDISTYSIGWDQDYEDVYFDWARRREVEEDGCVLVRPDRFVAWRANGMIEDCAGKLGKVLKSILGRE
ncbi:hypothetical protein GQ43DRAFT_446779 [Delitschia confertaspora ATCC 74209]|uniref:FAD-binding domain-containing protein n=1 Tax=Delitschia confertaspora ATCC 74209 TaxID=1513339 RepID=A0A9P4MV61_9PLEO|nr:hypothetical protein GQ43DRAFT_446779 [Delitschia confertaspora ATCC 74209]